MTPGGWAVFATALGHCGIGWNDRGIVAVQLPEGSAAATAARLARRLPGTRESTPPPQVAEAVAAIVALLEGARPDMRPIRLDLDDSPAFNRDVYAVARSIQPGTTRTYGEIAVELGDRALAQDVGKALGQNPCPLIVPCHRVLAAGGRPGGFSARGGTATKLRLLAIEGVRLDDGPTLFDFAAGRQWP
jgi:methylated-DNA-[protein]-cysteine S-methyltransferase